MVQKVPINISDPSTVNKLMDIWMLLLVLRPQDIPSQETKTGKIYTKKKNQEGDILRLLRENNLEGKWIRIYVNEEQHLTYWKLVRKGEGCNSTSNWIKNITYIS